jgi:23S rRNA pseudouridine1911/1915/1917 synthase
MISPKVFKSALLQLPQKVTSLSLSPRTFTLSVKKRFHNYSILDLYTESFPHVDQGYWREKIISGNLKVDQQVVSITYPVKAGQITTHTVPPKEEPPVSWDLELLAATDSYWVLNKPSPLPVHAGGRYLYNTLTSGLKLAFPNQKFHLINRLDANTTCIVLVALNKETAKILGQQFENRIVKKTYLALVEGIPSSKNFSSSKSIGKLKTAAGGRSLSEGIESNTDFKCLESNNNQSLLQVTPHSGRTNQIRLHLAGLNLPIVGDLGYKNPVYFETHPLTYATDSLFLHAWKLVFKDPNSTKDIEYTCGPNFKWKPYRYLLNG